MLKQEEVTKQKYRYLQQSKNEIGTFGSIAYLKRCDIYDNRKH